MSRSPIRQELKLNDGLGNKLPIQTGTFATKAINVDEHRRLSLTIGVSSATGVIGAGGGGFTGILEVQGTDELAQCAGATGTQEAGDSSRPGVNGFTGAVFWQTIPSGTVAVTNATNKMLLQFNEVNCAFVRVVFNRSATGPTVTGTLGGSGTMSIFLTAKNA